MLPLILLVVRNDGFSNGICIRALFIYFVISFKGYIAKQARTDTDAKPLCQLAKSVVARREVQAKHIFSLL